MIILTSIVGRGFYQELIESRKDQIDLLIYIVDQLGEKEVVELHVITDRNEEEIRKLFNGIHIHIHVYPYHIWDYVDKLYYSFKLNYVLNRGVLWIDVDKVSVYEMTLLHHNFQMEAFIRYQGEWEDRDDNVHHLLDPYFKPLIGGILNQHSGWEFRGSTLSHIHRDKYVNPMDIPLIHEQILYLPKRISTETILTDIFSLKGTFSHMSAINNFPYKYELDRIVVGNGEGVLLGVIINKYNLPYRSF